MTDTGELADYVLPDAMSFERQDIIMPACYNHVVLQEPAIEPAADVMEPVELWSGLGKRMGYGEYFDKTNDEWCEIRLQSPYPLIASVEPPITLERLKAEKAIQDIQALSALSTADSGKLMNIPQVSIRMAIAFVAILPILVIYPFLQKYFASGIMLGAVKG